MILCVDVGIGLIGVMVVHVERAYFGTVCQMNHFRDGRMPPANFLSVLILYIGAIGYQCVCVPYEGRQFLDIGAVVKTGRFGKKLIVGDVADGAVLVIDPVPQAMSRVIEQNRLHLDAVDGNKPFFQVLKGHGGAEFFDFDGEIDTVHLSGNQFTDGNISMGRPHDIEFIALLVQGGEKGQGIDVVPMGMGNEYLGFDF